MCTCIYSSTYCVIIKESINSFYPTKIWITSLNLQTLEFRFSHKKNKFIAFERKYVFNFLNVFILLYWIRLANILSCTVDQVYMIWVQMQNLIIAKTDDKWKSVTFFSLKYF